MHFLVDSLRAHEQGVAEILLWIQLILGHFYSSTKYSNFPREVAKRQICKKNEIPSESL